MPQPHIHQAGPLQPPPSSIPKGGGGARAMQDDWARPPESRNMHTLGAPADKCCSTTSTWAHRPQPPGSTSTCTRTHTTETKHTMHCERGGAPAFTTRTANPVEEEGRAAWLSCIYTSHQHIPAQRLAPAPAPAPPHSRCCRLYATLNTYSKAWQVPRPAVVPAAKATGLPAHITHLQHTTARPAHAGACPCACVQACLNSRAQAAPAGKSPHASPQALIICASKTVQGHGALASCCRPHPAH
jgi:hypothetical protein